MRKSSVVLVFFCISLSIVAQYRKMPLDTNHYWQEKITKVGAPQDFGTCTYLFKIEKDSLINGKVYKWVKPKVLNWTGPNLVYPQNQFIREDTLQRIVFIRGGPSGEQILFNFNKNVGDTATLLTFSGLKNCKLIKKDSILLNGFYHRRFWFSPDSTLSTEVAPIIEGVGSTGGLTKTWFKGFEIGSTLLCVGQINPLLSIYSVDNLSDLPCPNITGIRSPAPADKGLSIYPNPSSDLLTIVGENDIKSIEIRNILGEAVLTFAEINSGSAELNVSDLPDGLYFVNVRSGNLFLTRQFIKN